MDVFWAAGMLLTQGLYARRSVLFLVRTVCSLLHGAQPKRPSVPLRMTPRPLCNRSACTQHGGQFPTDVDRHRQTARHHLRIGGPERPVAAACTTAEER